MKYWCKKTCGFCVGGKISDGKVMKGGAEGGAGWGVHGQGGEVGTLDSRVSLKKIV